MALEGNWQLREIQKKGKELAFISTTFKGRQNIQKVLRETRQASLMKGEMTTKMLILE